MCRSVSQTADEAPGEAWANPRSRHASAVGPQSSAEVCTNLGRQPPPHSHPENPRTPISFACTEYTFVRHAVYMAVRRITIEIDEKLLAKAMQALGLDTAQATVEEALRQAAQRADTEFADRAQRQRHLLTRLPEMVDVDVLASDQMWR